MQLQLEVVAIVCFTILLSRLSSLLAVVNVSLNRDADERLMIRDPA